MPVSRLHVLKVSNSNLSLYLDIYACSLPTIKFKYILLKTIYSCGLKYYTLEFFYKKIPSFLSTFWAQS